MIPRLRPAMPARPLLPSLYLRPRAALAPTTRPHLLQTRFHADRSRDERSPDVNDGGALAHAQEAQREDAMRRSGAPTDDQPSRPRSTPWWIAGLMAMYVAGMIWTRNSPINVLTERPEETDGEREMRNARLAREMAALPIVKSLAAEDGWVEVGGMAQEVRRVQRRPWDSSAAWKTEDEREKINEDQGVNMVLKEEGKHVNDEYVRDWLGSSPHLLGPRRVWWNAQKGEGVSVGWSGQGASGWPTVIHGGALASVLSEAVRLGWEKAEEEMVGRGIQQQQPQQPSSSSASASTTPRSQPLRLSLTYLAPTRANTFYVIRFAPSPPSIPAQRGAETDLPPSKDMTKKRAPHANTLQRPPVEAAEEEEEWTATLETANGGKVGVKAWVVMRRRETSSEAAEAHAGAKKSSWKPWA